MTDKIGLYTFETPVVLYYSDLFTPKAYMENGVAKGEPKFKMQVIIRNDDPQLAELKKLALDVAAQGGLGNAQARFAQERKDGGLSHPFTPGRKIIEASKAKGKDTTRMEALLGTSTVFRATSNRQPRLYGGIGGIPTLTTDEKLFYPGAFVFPVVFLNAFDGMGGGVNAYVNDILAIPGGEKIAGEVKIPTNWQEKLKVAETAGTSW